MPQAPEKQARESDTTARATDTASEGGRKRTNRHNGERMDKARLEEVPAEEAETDALVTIQRALVPLSLESKRKVLRWFVTNYSVSSEPKHPGAEAKGRAFADLAALFEAVHPSTDVERVLAACYFHNEIQNDPDMETRTLANDLRQIGHNLPNISASLRDLNVRTPSLVMIASANRARHKRYRITSAGTKYIQEMMMRRQAES
jgi:hypothetical protein